MSAHGNSLNFPATLGLRAFDAAAGCYPPLPAHMQHLHPLFFPGAAAAAAAAMHHHPSFGSPPTSTSHHHSLMALHQQQQQQQFDAAEHGRNLLKNFPSAFVPAAAAAAAMAAHQKAKLGALATPGCHSPETPLQIPMSTHNQHQSSLFPALSLAASLHHHQQQSMQRQSSMDRVSGAGSPLGRSPSPGAKHGSGKEDNGGSIFQQQTECQGSASEKNDRETPGSTGSGDRPLSASVIEARSPFSLGGRQMLPRTSSQQSSHSLSHSPIMVRASRNSGGMEPWICPVCGAGLKEGEVESHCALEIERLAKGGHGLLDLSPGGAGSGSLFSSASRDSSSPHHGGPGQTMDPNPNTRWETYQRIRANRHTRLRLKQKRRRDSSPEGGFVPGNAFLSPGGRFMPLDGFDFGNKGFHRLGDNEGSEAELKERWIRRHRFLQDGKGPKEAGEMFGSKEDEEMDLVVDGDDTTVYGPAQYTESDILKAAARSQQKREEVESSTKDVEIKRETDADHPNGIMDNAEKDGDKLDQSPSGILNHDADGMMAKFGSLASQKCHICSGSYEKPLVSISCWHVHCEKCWLQALGEQKLCPQCNVITSPSELRRIFL